MADDDPPRSYSIAVRIRRTTVEFVHVCVPVTEAVVIDDHLDPDKVFAAAIEVGKTDASLRWLCDASRSSRSIRCRRRHPSSTTSRN